MSIRRLAVLSAILSAAVPATARALPLNAHERSTGFALPLNAHERSTGFALPLNECYARALGATATVQGGRIHVRRETEAGAATEVFSITNDRTLSWFREMEKGAPASFYDSAGLDGKKVLDAGCGSQAAFVRSLLDLKGVKIDAHGIDLHIDPAFRRDPRLWQGDVTRMPFYRDGEFDVIYSHFNIFFQNDNPRLHPVSERTRLEALREFRRVLKPGGLLRIYPASDPGAIRELLRDLPGFEEIPNACERCLELRRLPGSFK